MLKWWLFRLRFWFNLRRLNKEPTAGRALKLLQLLEPVFVEHYNPNIGLNNKITVHCRNIGNLVDYLNFATDLMREDEYVDRSIKGDTARTIRLDDYLTTDDDRPVDLWVAIKSVVQRYNSFVKARQPKDENKTRYYQRQFLHLEEDVIAFIKSIDWVIKQAP